MPWQGRERMSSSILVSLAAWLVVRTSMETGPVRAVGPAQPFSRRTFSSPMITRCFYVLGCGGGKCQTIDALSAPPRPQTGHYTKTALLPNESRSPRPHFTHRGSPTAPRLSYSVRHELSNFRVDWIPSATPKTRCSEFHTLITPTDANPIPALLKSPNCSSTTPTIANQPRTLQGR